MQNMVFIEAMLLLSCTFAIKAASDCSSYSRCEDCIRQDPTCAWCNDIAVLESLALNASTTGPAELCGTMEELIAKNCGNVINPETTVHTENMSSQPGSSSYVSLTSATVNLRPGQPASFNVTISPPISSSVDMYLLLDLSLTMQQSLSSLRGLAKQLVTRMSNVTSDFRIGFGSFIDKTVPPFADKFSKEFPCAEDATLLGITTNTCEPVYAFRHVLNFTANHTELEEKLNNSKLSASPDHPEGILDAMLQSAVCEEELGWRPRGQSQRIIVAFTDGDYHYALDGKIAGIVNRPSSIECRLDPVTHEYTTAHLFDYPSSALISDALNDNLITPIFAVPSQVRSVYDGLVGSIRSASVETLSAEPTSILSLIENQYRILSGTVAPILTPDLLASNELNITVLPLDECGAGALRQNTSDVCVGINHPNKVTYTVQVSAGLKACQLPQPIQAQIQFIRFGTVRMEINLQCDCDSCSEPVENSEVCNGQGSLECSTCVCNNDQIGGALCGCSLILGRSGTGCIDPFDSEGRLCNGQGVCDCGRCQCDQISDDSPLVFQGAHCQYNPLNCPQARNSKGIFKPCAGNGVCTNSRCVCNDGFAGGACECTLDNSTCIRPGQERDGVLCSGNGQCVCGQCICGDYSQNFGEFCEQCLPCRTSCSRISPCVHCLSVEGVACQEDLRCDERVIINDVENMASMAGMKMCSLREGSCEVRYFLSTNIRGSEEHIQVFMDSSQGSLGTLREGSNDCSSSTPVWPIIVGTIVGIIIVGLLVLVLWRCCTYLGEYLEYQQWEKSVKNETSRSGENPLFLSPTEEYPNPRYNYRS